MDEKITITCECGKRLTAPADKAGHVGKCPNCGRDFLITPDEVSPGRRKGFSIWPILNGILTLAVLTNIMLLLHYAHSVDLLRTDLSQRTQNQIPPEPDSKDADIEKLGKDVVDLRELVKKQSSLTAHEDYTARLDQIDKQVQFGLEGMRGMKKDLKSARDNIAQLDAQVNGEIIKTLNKHTCDLDLQRFLAIQNSIPLVHFASTGSGANMFTFTGYIDHEKDTAVIGCMASTGFSAMSVSDIKTAISAWLTGIPKVVCAHVRVLVFISGKTEPVAEWDLR